MPSPKDKEPINYQMLYSVGDIAKARGITHKGARKFMIRLGIREHFVGGKCFYWMSDLETQCPELLPSMIEAAQKNDVLDKLRNEKEEYITDLIKKVLNEKKPV